MNFIVAVDKNWAIGSKNKLLFSLPYDLGVNFKGRTVGNTIVIGANTLKSFPRGKALPRRRNVVLCDTGEVFDNCTMVKNLDELFDVLCTVKGEVFVCGGASVYRQLIPYCEYGYVTKVSESVEEADAFIPNIDQCDNWSMVERGDPIIDNGYVITICKYVNKQPLTYVKSK